MGCDMFTTKLIIVMHIVMSHNHTVDILFVNLSPYQICTRSCCVDETLPENRLTSKSYKILFIYSNFTAIKSVRNFPFRAIFFISDEWVTVICIIDWDIMQTSYSWDFEQLLCIEVRPRFLW